MKLKFCIFQKKTKVGDLKNNFLNFKKDYEIAEKNRCNFFITTELALCGYPPKDLLLRRDFINEVKKYNRKVIKLTSYKKSIFTLGTVIEKQTELFNALLIIKNGKILKSYSKIILPNYGVFDEKRYFKKSKIFENTINYRGFKIGFLICEDLWDDDLCSKISKKKNDFLITLNASPYEKGKFSERLNLVKNRIDLFKSPILYINLVGAQDDLIFDGGSFCLNTDKKIIYQLPFFENVCSIFNYEAKSKHLNKHHIVKYKKEENLYNALVLSLREYVKSSGFSSVLLGLSGGIDSALSATISCDALGSENVRSYFLPTKYSSKESRNDSFNLAHNLKINVESINIEKLRNQFNLTLSKQFTGLSEDITEENIQSRIRGSLLMALSNKFNSLLVTTGNKSELAVGYSTIYGDMCGGFSIIKDLYKTEVFNITKWRNKNYTKLCLHKFHDIIPINIIEKEPTAELKFNQKDSDSLPSYDILDKILFYLIEKNLSLKQIEKKGFKKKLIFEIWNMIRKSEYKRFQSVIGPKVSSMSFDSERRFPLVNKFNLN